MNILTRLLALVAIVTIGVIGTVHADDDDDERKGGKKSEYRVKYDRDGCEYEYRESRKGYRESLECDGIWRDIPKQKYEHEVDGCKYKYKADRRGYEERYECKHGWAGFGTARRSGPGDVFAAPSNAALGIPQGRCDHELLGRILGGVAGAAAGSRLGKGDGRTAAVIGSTIIGVLIGGSIGRHLDEVDQNCVAQTLEHAPDKQTVRWSDEATGQRYQVTPMATSTAPDGRQCREYLTTVTIDGKVEQAYGTACRQPDGSWQAAR